MLTRLKKKQKIEYEKLVNSFMGVFWDPAMFPLIAPFIGANDTTRLGMTCRGMKLAVDSSVGDSPRLVWEKRAETKIGFERLYDDDDDEEDVQVAVSQIQEFVFCLTDQRLQQQASVELSLENRLWYEWNNSVWMKPRERNARTRMRVVILLPETSRQSHERLFVTHPDSFSFLGKGEVDYHDYIEEGNVPTWNEEDEDLLRCAMGYTLGCVRRIANWRHDDTIYPSAEYLMRSLPAWLHPYFPKDFDWQALHDDRNTNVEFTYRPAPTDEMWQAVIPPEHDGVHLYTPEQVPWYGLEWNEDEYWDNLSYNDDSDEEGRDCGGVCPCCKR